MTDSCAKHFGEQYYSSSVQKHNGNLKTIRNNESTFRNNTREPVNHEERTELLQHQYSALVCCFILRSKLVKIHFWISQMERKFRAKPGSLSFVQFTLCMLWRSTTRRYAWIDGCCSLIQPCVVWSRLRQQEFLGTFPEQ